MAENPAQSLVGQQVGPYKIHSLLGMGGMGEVYLAQDPRLDRTIALKILPAELASDPDRIRRFIREARAASGLKHPNVATIYEIGKSDEFHFIAMEYVEGQTLGNKIGGRPLPIAEIVEIGIQVADALDEAHRKRITHRDIKPANLMLTSREQVKILDFGLAKVTQSEGQVLGSDISTVVKTETGLVMGTVQYMSPEQVLGKEVDHRTDIFSLGVVLYEMATGRLPFTGTSTSETMDRVLHGQPEAIARFNYNVPADLERIIRKCLEKDRERRYQSARDLLIDLKNLKRESDSEHTLEKSEHREKSWIGLGVFGVGVLTLKLLTARRTWVVLIAALLVIGAVTALLLFRQGGPTAAEIKSLAVLPLKNLSNDPEQDYFAEGMTEALINHLAQIRALRVISRTSAMHYKGTAKQLPEIARELKVDVIVEGSVLHYADRVRIAVQLIHGPTEQSLWASSYERDLRDVLELQRETAQTIAQEIQIKVTPAEQARLARVRPVKREAYLDYLKGRHHWNKRTQESVNKAIEHFQSAIEEDPTYAPAYAGLSDCYSLLGTTGVGAKSPRETRPLAVAAARKALQIDGELAEAHTAIAVIHHYEWEWVEAEQGFRRALELNPGYSNAHSRYSQYLASRGRLDEAVAEARRAEELDPLLVNIKWTVAYILNFARRHDEAIQQLQNTLELDPNYAWAHWTLGVSYVHKSMFAEAIASLEKAVALSKSPSFVAWLGSAHAMSGNTVQARKFQRELMDLQKQRYVSPAAIAQLHISLGEKDRAFEWLEKAYQERSNFMANLGVNPIVDPLRSDPRFKDLLRRIGLEK